MRCSKHSNHALTLIEVVASLALLGTLLVSIVLAQGRYVRQFARAQRKIEAVQIAEQLLEQWSKTEAGIPLTATGELPRGMYWQTEILQTEALSDLDVERLRLQIMETTEASQPIVLTQVDVLVQRKQDEDDESSGK